MDAAENIRQNIARVTELRAAQASNPALAAAMRDIKQFQSRRFMGSYTDLMRDPTVRPATQFFLDELYSPGDYSARDAQFARIAGAIERTFPESVVATVLALAKLHRQTEELDMAMAQQFCNEKHSYEPMSYLGAWRKIGQRDLRCWQLSTVLEIGRALGRYTRKPGLRLMLKMMRRPAELAGMASLQRFLESGFDHFAGMARQPAAVGFFLDTIRARETYWINTLFDASSDKCVTELMQVLSSDTVAA